MGIAFLDKKGGGSKINGIIENYYVYAGENVSAGDFVEFINGIANQINYGTSTDTVLNSATYSGEFISATLLSDGNVLVLHSSSSSYYLYGMVCTVNGSVITKGTDTQINGTSCSGRRFQSLLLPSGNVLVTYEYDGANKFLHGMILTVSGTTITKGTDTAISTFTNSSYHSLALLSNGNVFVAHGGNGALRGIILTISETTITKGTEVSLKSNNSDVYYVSPVELLSGNVFIAYDYRVDSSGCLYGAVTTVSGTTITLVSAKTIVSGEYTGRNAMTKLLPSGNVFIAHGDSSNDLWGIVISPSGTTFSVGTDIELGSNDASAIGMSIVLLNNGNIFISRTGEGVAHYYLYGTVLKISDTTVTKLNDAKLSSSTYSGKTTSAVMLSNGTLFIAHSNIDVYSQLYAQMFGIVDNIPTNNLTATTYETQVKVSYGSSFKGVAKTSGAGGTSTSHKDQVMVVVPNK